MSVIVNVLYCMCTAAFKLELEQHADILATVNVLYCDVSWQNFMSTAGFKAELHKDADMWVTVNILYRNASRQTSSVLLIHTAFQSVSSFFLQALYKYGDQCVV